MTTFQTSEKYLSQIPALVQLIKLGYEYLPSDQVWQQRRQRASSVLLEDILRTQLGKINRIRHKGGEYVFSEANIEQAIQRLKGGQHGNLHVQNEENYNLLTLGTALLQRIDGDSKSFTLNYIDWKNPQNNAFHVVAEFSVERVRSTETVRPDIVLFINGIPIVVIECKAPDIEMEQGIEQMIRNQKKDYVPQLFAYTQLVLATNKNRIKYATAGTKKKFWSEWKERDDVENAIKTLVNRSLSNEDKDALFSGEFTRSRRYFDELEGGGGCSVTAQDRAIYSLCRPQRLLELMHGFIVFDGGEKKIARYQQFFLVRSALQRIGEKDDEGRRRGGVVWHTQGSGKSITMVMLARALAQTDRLPRLRMLLVTDRIDLEEQLGETFANCGLEKAQATTGRNLIEHLKNSVSVITTLVQKFDNALGSERYSDDSADIVVLVDESHRTQYGNLAGRMRRMLPNASYIGFTGTPLTKDEKNSYVRFGELIAPHYPIRQAVEDQAVVPLLYEGRHIEMYQEKAAIDKWFERHTRGLTDEQKADLKKKYARVSPLMQADRVVSMGAFDISEHFRKYWQMTGLKAQLVAPNKKTALKYHRYLEGIGDVSSAVVISAADTREGHEEVDGEGTDEVVKFWDRMMDQYGDEKSYNDSIIKNFKEAGDPEILIVVDKLITGFDAPRNTVLYLCRPLKEHTLLQAIARVNRLHEDKEYGYIIDYANVLKELHNALSSYDALAMYDQQDLAGGLTAIDEHVKQLPQHYAALCDLFKGIKPQDEEAHELHLADDKRRHDFYECLTQYGKTLAIALSTEKFLLHADESLLKSYKADMKRFHKLKKAVKKRYAEVVDYRDYEPRIQKLLDTHITADDVNKLNEAVNILDDGAFNAVQEARGIYAGTTTASKADTIAHQLKRTIKEKMEQDPALYKKFSKMVQQAIDEFKDSRITPEDYFQQVGNLRDDLVNGTRDDVPEAIRSDGELSAYFGAVKGCLSVIDDDIVEAIARSVEDAISKHWCVRFWQNDDAQRKVRDEIDDYFFDVINKGAHGIRLSSEQMDGITAQTLNIARTWRPS